MKSIYTVKYISEELCVNPRTVTKAIVALNIGAGKIAPTNSPHTRYLLNAEQYTAIKNYLRRNHARPETN